MSAHINRSPHVTMRRRLQRPVAAAVIAVTALFLPIGLLNLDGLRATLGTLWASIPTASAQGSSDPYAPAPLNFSFDAGPVSSDLGIANPDFENTTQDQYGSPANNSSPATSVVGPQPAPLCIPRVRVLMAIVRN